MARSAKRRTTWMSKFVSVAASAGRALRDFLVEQEVQRRQQMLDGIMLEDRFRQSQLQEQALQRQARLDAQEEERYKVERQDKLMARADDQAVRFQNAELTRIQREEDQKQRNLDRADAAAFRYQDAELRREDEKTDRAFHARENEAQRANARAIAGMQMAGRADKT